MERSDEASELASLADSADTEASRPPSFPERTQEPVSPPSTGPSGSPTPPQDSSSNNASDKSPLVRSSSMSDDYIMFLRKPHHVEKRFPVDRKKLEKLITEGGRNNETADEFFQRVQDSTSTLVLWPSRLKIGAKSKKDPQVKVVGLPANIQQARELILSDLDAKSTRVTLKIDVAYSEHSHVIGKEGINIKKVHNETKCHIHFPDSNRSNYGGERSNQVSITGQGDNIEVARRRIRELLPAAVTFALPLPAQFDSNTANSQEVQQIMQQYNVIIHLKPQSHQYTLLVVVRGTMKFLGGLKLAVSRLVEYFTGDIHLIPMVSLNLDIATQHYRTLIGSGGGNIRKIMAETSTTIQFPDPQSRFASGHVVVTGDVDSVFAAREQLLGCLPAVLMFDVHESDENVLSSSLIGDLMQHLDLFISVKPKKGQLQSVIIKSIEQNIQCMYKARTSLLECSYQPVSSPQPLPTIPDSISPSTSPRTTPTPSQMVVKEVPSRVTFSEGTTLIKKKNGLSDSGEETKISSEVLERRVSFKEGLGLDERLEDSLREGAGPDLLTSSSEEEKQQLDKVMEGHTSPIPEMRPRSSSLQRAGATPPMRPTTRQFLDYDRKREQAQQAMKSKVEPSKLRYPTTKYAGNYFSESMPAGAQKGVAGVNAPPSPTSTPQGLSSINRTSYRALMNEATRERAQNLLSEQDNYRDVSSLSELLQQLNLEHYESCFEQEEVDLDTFLTMTESDLKEVGVTTLGARRKLQIAISELKKKQNKVSLPPGPASLPGGPRSSASLGRGTLFRSNTGSSMVPPGAGSAILGGINRSASLTREPKFSGMSRSGRF